MKVVILCGGKGMRLKPYTENSPKVMMKIGVRPLLWHIMKIYSAQGYNQFILCLGSKGEMIKEYFENLNENFDINYVDTGLNTMTGGRIKMIEKCVDEDYFFATYGDGVADIDFYEELKFHLLKGKTATLTAVRTNSQFGMLIIKDDHVSDFQEKPILNYYVNGGFFVFRKDIFDYIDGASDVLEREVFTRLVEVHELCAYRHNGFWQCVDTFKDLNKLNDLWKTDPRWKIWSD